MFPVQEGMDDDSYKFVFEPIMQKVRRFSLCWPYTSSRHSMSGSGLNTQHNCSSTTIPPCVRGCLNCAYLWPAYDALVCIFPRPVP